MDRDALHRRHSPADEAAALLIQCQRLLENAVVVNSGNFNAMNWCAVAQKAVDEINALINHQPQALT